MRRLMIILIFAFFSSLAQAKDDYYCEPSNPEISPESQTKTFVNSLLKIFNNEEQTPHIIDVHYQASTQEEGGNAKDITELRKMQNCIDYNSCFFGRPFIKKRGMELTARFTANLNSEEANRIAQKCSELSGFKGKLRIVNVGQNKEVHNLTIDNLNKEKLISPFNIKIVQDKKSAHEELSKLITNKKYLEAASLAVKKFGFPIEDYQIKIEEPKEGASLAEVDRSLKTIFISKNWFKNSCTLLRALRHEAEHIYQYNHIKNCKNENVQSYFAIRNYRERAAYENDALNTSDLCLKDDRNTTVRSLYWKDLSKSIKDYPVTKDLSE